MNTGVVSRRYAKALLAYAKTRKVEDKVYEEVRDLAQGYLNIPGLRRAIENPVLDAEKKEKLLCEATGKEKVSDELEDFFRLVLEKKREKFLHFMLWSYIDLYHEDKNILTGKLITAVPSEHLVQRMVGWISAKTHGKVELETNVNPNLIGGYIIEIEGTRLDASIAHQLACVKQQFIARNRRIV